MKKITSSLKKFISVSIVATLTGCAATETLITHHNLDVKTKMSETIYLEPVPHDKKTVFVSIKNTSDQVLDVNSRLKSALKAEGYQVVNNPINAHYLLQGNILQVGKMSESASNSALTGGFGSTLLGAGTGVALGSLTGNTNAMIAGGLAGGLVSFAADSLVKSVNYTMITDIQISERVGKGVKVREQFNASLMNGATSHTQQLSTKSSNYQRFRTRIVSNANKVNLQFQEARPALEMGLAKVIAGIF